MVTAASDGPLLHSPGWTGGKSEFVPGMGVGSNAMELHGGWVGEGVTGIWVGSAGTSVTGAHAPRKNTKTKNKRRKRIFFMRKSFALKKESERFTFGVHPEVELQDSEITDH
jgi:hypothetical protein